MAKKIVTITIDEEGDQTVDLTGYNGKGCDAVADVFGRAVGATTKVVHKPDFNKPCINTNVIRH